MHRRIFCNWIVLLLLAACGARPSVVAPQPPQMSVAEGMAQADVSGYARAVAPRVFSFPADHGPHPEYAVEWWYATGNLRGSDGAQFGYQFTIFRTATPQKNNNQAGSAWRADAVYMAHVAVTDVRSQGFTAHERFQRGTLGLAGAQAAPLRVWVDDWQFVERSPGILEIHAHTPAAGIDLTLDLNAAIVLQGKNGLSQKSAQPGNASYYYSIPRMQTVGTVRVGNISHPVTGVSWLDREWSTSALSSDQIGWDWFALHLDDGSDVMLYQLRTPSGATHSYSSGSVRHPDGTQTQLTMQDIRWEPQGVWQSPHTGAQYPAEWRLSIPPLHLTLLVEPLVADQELPVLVRYWEGAVRVTGTRGLQPVTGEGYLEMTGYADTAPAAP